MSKHNIVSHLKQRKIQDVVMSGRRMDGRGLEDYRELTIRSGMLEKSEGSAEVYLGKTHVVVGVKVGTGTPFEDTPDEGVLMCNAEFTPIASPEWEPGPPNEDSIELARVVDRGLRSAEVLDTNELSIIPGKLVHIVFVDFYVLNYDGNLIDACSAGALAALMKAKKQVYEVKEKEPVLTDKKVPLTIRKKPVAVSMVKIGGNFIFDPTADEEEVMDARLTVTFDEDGNVCTMQKSGSEGLTMEEIKKCINTAAAKAPEIRAKVLASTK
ncbi:exosome complex protein Rrp42 [Candidatus Bathyarchaeota archaeon]|nr:exosome complex protein Rrp42 [Candidatus Bathyarchaeota archaeon]